MLIEERVGDSFVADVNHFAPAVGYAVDNGASVVQEALGTVNNSSFARDAVAVRLPAQRGRDRLGGRRGGEAPQLPVELSRHDHRELGDQVRLGRIAALLPVPQRVHQLRRPHGGGDPLLLVLIGGHRQGGRDGGAALLGRPQRRAKAHLQRGPPAVHHESGRHRLPDGEAAGARRELRHQPVGREQALPVDPRIRRVLRLRPGQRGPHGARGGQREHPARGRDHRSRLVHARLAGRRPARGAGPGGRPPCTHLRLRGVGRARDDQGPGRARLRGAQRVAARVGDAPAVLELGPPPRTPRGALLGLDRAPARGAREPAHERARSTSRPATATRTGSRSRSASGCATTTVAPARTAAARSCIRTPTPCPASRAAFPRTARPRRGSRT